MEKSSKKKEEIGCASVFIYKYNSRCHEYSKDEDALLVMVISRHKFQPKSVKRPIAFSSFSGSAHLSFATQKFNISIK